jgi:hypothetical protein
MAGFDLVVASSLWLEIGAQHRHYTNLPKFGVNLPACVRSFGAFHWAFGGNGVNQEANGGLFR